MIYSLFVVWKKLNDNGLVIMCASLTEGGNDVSFAFALSHLGCSGQALGIPHATHNSGGDAAFWFILGFVKGSSLREPEETGYLLRHLAAPRDARLRRKPSSVCQKPEVGAFAVAAGAVIGFRSLWLWRELSKTVKAPPKTVARRCCRKPWTRLLWVAKIRGRDCCRQDPWWRRHHWESCHHLCPNLPTLDSILNPVRTWISLSLRIFWCNFTDPGSSSMEFLYHTD